LSIHQNYTELFAKIKNDDIKAYESVYRIFYVKLCRYLSNFCSEKTIVEDIVQDVLINLWAKRKGIEINTSLESYLYKAAYFSFLDYYRKHKRINENLEQIRYALVNEVEHETTENKEKQVKVLHTAIETLPSKCKEILLLNKYEGYRYKEIAEHLNLSVKTVENQMGRAFSIIRKYINSATISLLFYSFLQSI